ncbi:MAG: hypothetical protein ABSF22_27120, partial [Bryobacteraceae bacterium]
YKSYGSALLVPLPRAVLGFTMAPYRLSIREAAEREESTQVKSMIEESNNGIVTIEIREPDDVETFGIY